MYKSRKWLTIITSFSFYVALLLLSSCDNGIIGTGAKPQATLWGCAQKGPFEIGSNITISIRPGPDYIETSTVQVQTLDGIGTFDFTFEPGTLYDITVTGRHLNEITGQLTATPNSLKSTYFHSSNNQTFVSINILTHLIHSRINYLVANGVTPLNASIQASEELITELSEVIFAEHLSDPNFSAMAVYNIADSDNNANAVLLFISAAFYQQTMLFPKSATLAEIIDFIANDLETDGKIGVDGINTDNGLISSLDYAAHALNPDTITANLTNYSIAVTGSALPVPDINFLLDNDRDGITNDIDKDDDGDGFPDAVDDNPYLFEIKVANQSFTTTPNTPVAIDLQFSQPEAHLLDSIFVGYVTEPTNGVLTGAYPNITYTPNLYFSGSDSFQYEVYCPKCSLLYASDVATVDITVQGP